MNASRSYHRLHAFARCPIGTYRTSTEPGAVHLLDRCLRLLLFRKRDEAVAFAFECLHEIRFTEMSTSACTHLRIAYHFRLAHFTARDERIVQLLVIDV